MKVCSSCGAELDNSAEICPECSSAFLSVKCSNCGEIYDASFCPVCGVEAGNDGILCPNCDKKYYGKSCPDCGYRKGMENANKVYAPTIKPQDAGNGNEAAGGAEETADGVKKHDLSGKGYTAQELFLAEMALNKNSANPMSFAALMPQKSKCKKTTALILCLLLGWVGAHQYYVGNSKKGMLYVMTMGLMFVGVLMDAAAIMRGDFTDSKGLPLS
ncbi:MAG: NINE protein [Clostridia bacterium]|nr:NINE protein [Clostridia bacterium]